MIVGCRGLNNPTVLRLPQWNLPVTSWSAVALGLRLGFEQHRLRIAVFGHAQDQLRAVLEALGRWHRDATSP